MTAETLFISDLHLSQLKPEISQHFLTFIKIRAVQARVLYILGDLFEVWLGDDDPADEFSEIFNALKKISESTDIFFLHGNRDFLVGQQLARKVGFQVLQSPCIIESGSKRIALLHGDELCTDDLEYQEFKTLVRSQQWQQEFLAKPLVERRAITTKLRAQSSAAMTTKEVMIMDVNHQAVIDTFEQLNVNTIIHGHTHRPGIHALAKGRQRFVLGDWNPEPSYISCINGELKLIDPRL